MTCSEILKYGKSIFPVFSFLALLFIGSFSSMAETESCSQDELPPLILKARTIKLHEDPYWWTLLHYKKSLLGVKSLVDDPAFFLADNGKTDPQAELEALIKTFFLNFRETDKDICHFIARYNWIRDQLEIDSEKYPRLFCEKAEMIEPKRATIVFPTYFLNNPASMFGHTFINISTEYSNQLLSNAVNYSAYTGTANGCFYTFNGVFGLFKGYYSILPYYKKIQEYSDMDQRDMWEYSLNLTEKELERMVHHIFEMEQIYSDYFFFDENCSFNLMFLLEVARPGVRLTDRFGPWVVPIDTIKLMKEEGLIGDFHYRPSIVTDIKHQMAGMDGQQADAAISIAKGGTSPKDIVDSEMNREEKIETLDLAADLTKYRYIKKKMPRKTYSKQLMTILKSRSPLGKTEKKKTEPVPFRDPAESHDTSRIAIAEGLRDGHFFQEVSIRPSFTDLLTSDYSDRVGIQLQLLNFDFRYYKKTETTRLEKFDFFSAVSLTPGDRFFKPLSWKVDTGLRRRLNDSGREKLAAYVKGGIGISRFSEITGIIYGFPVIELDAAQSFDEKVQAGAGIEAGMLKQWSPAIRSLVSVESIFNAEGSDYHEHKAEATVYGRLSRNFGVGLSGKLRRKGDDNEDESKLFLNWFF